MIRIRSEGRPVFIFMVLVAVSIALPCQSALAALMSTDAVSDGAGARERLVQYLDREDVRAALAAQGLDPEEAWARVACLTDAEVQQLVGQFDQLPAGGDALGVAIGVLVIVAIVLLILKFTGMLR
jgi:hypothetical protein